MAEVFISEPIYPLGTFDAARMSYGEPGLPEKFRWRQQELIIDKVLAQWKEYGDCKHGSGERYVRKHFYQVGTTDGRVLKIYFQRSFGRASSRVKSRWWLFSLEQ